MQAATVYGSLRHSLRSCRALFRAVYWNTPVRFWRRAITSGQLRIPKNENVICRKGTCCYFFTSVDVGLVVLVFIIKYFPSCEQCLWPSLISVFVPKDVVPTFIILGIVNNLFVQKSMIIIAVKRLIVLIARLIFFNCALIVALLHILFVTFFNLF